MKSQEYDYFYFVNITKLLCLYVRYMSNRFNLPNKIFL